MGDVSVGAIVNIGAWGLGLGTLFFSFFGIRAERDFFLMMGLVSCVVGDSIFAYYLLEQARDSDGEKNNDTIATLYVLLALLALYAIACQFESYRELGLLEEEEDDAPPEPPAAAAAGRPGAQPLALPAATGAGAAGGAAGGARRR